MPSPSFLLICAVFVSGCAMTPEPEVPSPPAPAPIVAPVPVAMEAAAPPWCPQDRVEVTRLERGEGQELPQPMATGLPKKGTKPLSPMQVVTEAQKAARVEPSARGYLGGSGEHVYRWMPGKVYTVYVTKKHGTGIFLPPGERLVSGLYLDADAYEVKTE